MELFHTESKFQAESMFDILKSNLPESVSIDQSTHKKKIEQLNPVCNRHHQHHHHRHSNRQISTIYSILFPL